MRGLLLVFLALGLAAHLPAQPAEADRIARLVEQLGHSDFDRREAARRDLDALGAAALPALRTALRSPDAEVRRRAEELLERIGRRVEANAALTPTHVHLTYKNVPLAEAVADFARKTGYTVRLEGVPPGRVVTLDTGKVTYWEAFGQFCTAAGVRERPEPVVNDPRKPINLNAPPAEIRFSPRAVILIDGRDTQPAGQAGNLLVRALPKDMAQAGQKLLPGELLLGLEVIPEPGGEVRGVVAILIEKASDERGQTLIQRQGATERKDAPAAAGRANLILGGVPIDVERLGNLEMSPQRVPLRLVPAEKPSTKLAELRGTLVAQVRAPAQTLATVADVLKEKATAAGPAGCQVKVTQVDRSEADVVKLFVEVDPPQPPPSPESAELERLRQAFGRGGVNIRGTIVIGNRMINFGDGTKPGQPDELTAANFTMRDARGQVVYPTKIVSRSNVPGKTRAVELHYPAPTGGPALRSLAFSAPRIVVVDVPFVLRDVPLP